VVTVVVPVYNAGPYLQRCSPSLLDQSIGSDRFEIVYVDDGSTDGSGELLDELAAAHPNVRVHHQPNSGWPGKPRNVGIGLARGDYVQFVDQDDQLGPEALERLHALAVRSSADIVIGLMAGAMSGGARRLFRQNVEGASVLDSGAISSLTGHKMFRREFLTDNDIWFPEGYWRMEDLLFVLRAYVRDPVVSVLSDYPCYYWNEREDGSNHSRATYDLTEHVERLHTLFETVLGLEGNDRLRDALAARLFRTEVLGLVTKPPAGNDSEASSRLAHQLGVETVHKYLSPSVLSALAGVQRLQIDLLEHGTWEDFQLLTERLREVRPDVQLGRLRWEDERLVIPLTARLRWGDEPLRLVGSGGGFAWDPAFLHGLPVASGGELENPLAEITADVTIRDREHHVSWFAESTLAPGLTDDGAGRFVPTVTGEVRVDPSRIRGGAPLPAGRHPLRFHGSVLGVSRSVLLTSSTPGPREGLMFGEPPMLAGVSSSGAGSHRVELHVRPAAAALSRRLGRRPFRQRSTLVPHLGTQISLDAGLGVLQLPSHGLDLTADPVRVSLRQAPSGAPRLVVDRRTAAGTGLHRVVLGPGSLGVAVVVRGRIWWFVGSGSFPRARRVAGRARRLAGRRR